MQVVAADLRVVRQGLRHARRIGGGSDATRQRQRIWIKLNDGIYSRTLLIQQENAREIELRQLY